MESLARQIWLPMTAAAGLKLKTDHIIDTLSTSSYLGETIGGLPRPEHIPCG